MGYESEEQKLRELQPEAKAYNVSIGHSILCSVSKTGEKALKLQTRVAGGKMTSLAIGSYPQVSFAEALETARMMRDAIKRGDDPLQFMPPGLAAKKRARKPRVEKKTGEDHHRYKHGHTTWLNDQETREYTAYKMMMRRCYDPTDDSYPEYGGRGIAVCDEWREDRAAFLRDMGPCPEGWEIDRWDNGEGYNKKNCHWVPRWRNQRNRRNSIWVWLEEHGTFIYLPQAAPLMGITYSAARQRVGAGVLEAVRGDDFAAMRASHYKGVEIEREQALAEGREPEDQSAMIYPLIDPERCAAAEVRRKAEEDWDKLFGEGSWYRSVLDQYTHERINTAANQNATAKGRAA